jgi:hypothetical protein
VLAISALQARNALALLRNYRRFGIVIAPMRLTKRGEMTRFASGLFVGIVIGTAATAYAVGCFGSGTLSGWTVTKDGEEVCSDPEVDSAGKEIQCD